MNFDLADIRAVQKARPGLTDGQAEEVLGFLTDVYAVESYDIEDNQKLFKDTADYMFPLLLISA
ncbi:MAG: hypothetical protein KAV87_52710 [Desulfobacteraceae bacterium]|nr:hypothetical protein [Desulfobacteraceae bacterium]